MLMSVIAEVATECLLCRQLLPQSYACTELNETCPDPAIYIQDGNISAEDSPFVYLNCCTFNKYFHQTAVTKKISPISGENADKGNYL